MSVIDVIEVQDQYTGESLGLGLVDSTALHVLDRIEPLAAWHNEGNILGFAIAIGNASAELRDKRRRVNEAAKSAFAKYPMDIWRAAHE